MLRRIGSLSLSILLATAFTITVTTKQAHAYIDIGSATFFIQMAVASALASLFMLKTFWQRFLTQISSLLATIKGTKTDPE